MKKLFLLILIGVSAYWLYLYFTTSPPLTKIEKMQVNYGAQIEEVCKKMYLPPHYFKALTILESSGDRPAKTRFEPGIYQILKDVKEGKRKNYGQFTQKQLAVFSDKTLKKLATSWGPFQIMGYHCIPLGIDFQKLEGPESVLYGIQWAEKRYGNYLRRGEFEDAFHIHNTGQPLPVSRQPYTYDPAYITKGLKYIELFTPNL